MIEEEPICKTLDKKKPELLVKDASKPITKLLLTEIQQVTVFCYFPYHEML